MHDQLSHADGRISDTGFFIPLQTRKKNATGYRVFNSRKSKRLFSVYHLISLCLPMVEQSICKRNSKGFLPFLTSPAPEFDRSKGILTLFRCPSSSSGSGAYHKLRDALHKVVSEQLVKWAERWIMDMIQFEVQAVEIWIALCEGSDAVIVLCKSLSSNTEYLNGVGLTLGSTPNS